MANKKQTATFNGIKDGKILDIMPKTTTDNVLLPDGTRLTNKIKELENGGGGSGSASWDAVTDKPFETLGDGLSVDENGVLSVVGGGSIGSNATVDVLWDEIISSTGTYTLAKSIDDYDFLIASAWGWTSVDTYEQSNYIVIPKKDYYIRSTEGVGWAFCINTSFSTSDRRSIFQFDDNVTLNVVYQSTSKFRALYGVKLGSGGSGGGTTTPAIITDIIKKGLVKTYNSTGNITCEEGHKYLIFIGYLTEPAMAEKHTVYTSGADIISDIIVNKTGPDGIHIADQVAFIISANQTDVITRLEYERGYLSDFQYIVSFDITGYESVIDMRNMLTVEAGNEIFMEKEKFYMVFVGAIGGYTDLVVSPDQQIYYRSALSTGTAAYSHAVAGNLVFVKSSGERTRFALNSTNEKNCLYYMEIPYDTVSNKEISNGNVYSTEEQVIGTWIDGKPIYRKAYYVNVSFPSNADLDFTSHVSNFSEMDTLIKALGYKPSNKGFITINGYISSNKLMLHTDWGLKVAGSPNILILEYTKTADYTIETTSTGGYDASVSINGTTYLFTSVNTTPAIIDDTLQLSYGGESSGWQLKALVPIRDIISGIEYAANEIISSWLYNSSVRILLKKV